MSSCSCDPVSVLHNLQRGETEAPTLYVQSLLDAQQIEQHLPEELGELWWYPWLSG